MEIDNEKDSKPSDSEYDTAEEEPDIHFEKIKDPYINRIAEARKFNEGEVCDYYAFILKGYYAEGEPLAFFESIEEKIADIYKKELALKGGLKVRIVLYAYMKKIKLETPEPLYKTFPFKHETIEIIREDRINATIEKGYNEIIDQIEDEALQESGWSFVRAEEVFLEISAFRPLQGSSYLPLPEALDKPQLGIINPQNRDDNECFKWCISAYHTREEAIKANRKPPHLNEIWRLRRNANIANFEGIKFLATLHDIDKFEESNPNYAINIFKLFYREAFRKIKVDIDPLHISERNYQVEHMIDLLYLIEGEESLNDRKNQNDIPEGLKTHYKHILTYPGPNKASQRLILPEEDRTTQKPVINRESENIIKDLMENLQEDLEVILDKLCEIAPCEKITPELWRKYQTANKCWICEEKLHEAGYNKIRVFDPETKKYLGASHRKCHRKKKMSQEKINDSR
ncbi:8372_t:CDS:2 [Cetraspora pellucida]|uniref:8372_t:CDS:1 n=1 Tax=Cetraspora pellucida TaxID=1433469 RepID=A0ACA9L3B4_9GLOM|nr:8372_t:CDS:2 [Cetraspora pellucida]